MNERTPVPKGPESFPNESQVKEVVLAMLNGGEYIETNREEDDEGLRRLDFEVMVKGEKIIYGYMRRNPDTDSDTAIDEMICDDDGIPRSAEPLLLFKDNKWIVDPRRSNNLHIPSTLLV